MCIQWVQFVFFNRGVAIQIICGIILSFIFTKCLTTYKTLHILYMNNALLTWQPYCYNQLCNIVHLTYINNLLFFYIIMSLGTAKRHHLQKNLIIIILYNYLKCESSNKSACFKLAFLNNCTF